MMRSIANAVAVVGLGLGLLLVLPAPVQARNAAGVVKDEWVKVGHTVGQRARQTAHGARHRVHRVKREAGPATRKAWREVKEHAHHTARALREGRRDPGGGPPGAPDPTR